MTRLTDLLGIELPIIQAPMAGAQASAMAVAVSNAGGLGSIGCATLTSEALRKELSAIKAQTIRPYNVNFFCHVAPVEDAKREAAWRAKLMPHYQKYRVDPGNIPGGPGRAPFTPAAADLLEDIRPAVVSFHFGLPPADLLARVKALGARILGCATTLKEALWLEARGVDAIIAQGAEAGGHRGIFLSDDLTTQVGTFALVPQIVRAVKVPVIAAGGIADAQGVGAVLALGAAAAQIGTAYLLCPEATISAIHRAALKSEAARHTALTNIFTGRPARGIMNYAMKELGPINPDAPAFPLATSSIAPLRAKAESENSGDFTPLWSGQNATGCKEVPAAQLTRELAAAL
ncbi:MAG: NAD(P)H-dependent flavin oxidoreductase [Burkholderiales bacterium]